MREFVYFYCLSASHLIFSPYFICSCWIHTYKPTELMQGNHTQGKTFNKCSSASHKCACLENPFHIFNIWEKCICTFVKSIYNDWLIFLMHVADHHELSHILNKNAYQTKNDKKKTDYSEWTKLVVLIEFLIPYIFVNVWQYKHFQPLYYELSCRSP